MWAFPFLLVNGVLFVLILVAACIVTVGFSTFCDNLVEKFDPLDILE